LDILHRPGSCYPRTYSLERNPKRSHLTLLKHTVAVYLDRLLEIMVQQTSKPASGVVSAMRRIYNPLGFSKGYNFAFWFITMGCVPLVTLHVFTASPAPAC
jgi:hypothetical protein